MATVSPAARVLVVEDFEPFRRLICSMLSQRPDLQIIGDLADGWEAVRIAEELQPDLILLDIGLPSLNGLAAARRIRILSPNSKIIFVSQESSPEVIGDALDTGAAGYVIKTMVASVLPIAVEAALQGSRFLSDRSCVQEYAT